MTLTNINTFIRVMRDEEGIIINDFFQIPPKFWLFKFFAEFNLIKFIEFETEFSDGTFIITTTIPSNTHITSVPKVKKTYLPNETPLTKHLAIHKQ